MKKIILFVSAVALTISLNSCSSDSGGGNSVSFKVNGVSKSFKTFTEKEGSTVYVYGYRGNSENPTDQFSFEFQADGDTGAGVITNFNYSSEAETYHDMGDLTTNTTSNTATSAKGTFSGNLEGFGIDDKTIADGRFSVNY